MFSDIHLPRILENGDRIEDIVVPIKFGSKETAYHIAEHDIENIHSGNVYSLPRMALSFVSMNKALERNTNKLHKINKRKSDSLKDQYQYNAVAYDFEFTLYIATRTFTDTTIIVEQIASMFNPDITLRINEVDLQEEPTGIPVKLGDFSIELPEELAEDEIRLITSEVSLRMEGNLYMPIKNQEIINKLEVNLAIIESDRHEAGLLYGIDTEDSQSLASITNVDSTGTSSTHFENSKD